MPYMDSIIKKIPGSVPVKSFLGALLISGALAYPVFKTKNVKQGHDLFSQDKPEAIQAGQERARRDQRKGF